MPMPLIRSYKDLIVWQKSVDLAVDLYAATRRFPMAERFGLMSRIQRAGVSIPSNIAEGYTKDGPGNYLSHLSHARGSLAELDTQLIISNHVGFLSAATYRALAPRADEIGRMLRGLTDSVAASSAPGRAPRR
jgi:four helix bundle protein